MPDLKSVVSGQLSLLRKSKGFTLIELLIVISIIGILASLTLASYGGAQAKARDGVRKSDLAQLKRALELVKSDCDGNVWYPNLSDADIKSGSTLGAYLYQGGTNPYMNPIPKDPQDSSPQVYAYTNDTTSVSAGTPPCPSAAGVASSQQGTKNYTLSVKLERTTDSAGPASRDACNGKPGVPAVAGYVNGNYYVCNN